MIALDTESTGLDLRHGAKPFLVTTCNEEDDIIYFEWDVDPLTRQPQVNNIDRVQIEKYIKESKEIVFQNPKYDVKCLHTIGITSAWDWEKTYDTLLAGHLLRSDQPHDLTSMTLLTLGVNVKPFEDDIEKACLDVRTIVKREFPEWRIAKAGLPEMPSVKGKVWKNDMWLPRALIKEVVHSLNFNLLPDHILQPTVQRLKGCSIPIVRGTKWGNPFKIGKDGTREEVIKKYAAYIWKNESLMADLPELYGEELGCYCSPEICHGDVLRALCHPWMTVCSRYANSDSAVTLALFKKQRELLQEKNLWAIYLERLKLLPIVYQMEDGGVTLSGKRLESLYTRLTNESDIEHKICVNLADGEIETLPVSGVSNDLKRIVFEKFELESNKMTPKGSPSLDKSVLDHWLATLPEKSKARRFIQGLRQYRKRKTAIGYLESYQKFWLPTFTSIDENEDWYKLYSSLNPTGTATLRFSSSNPNQQQISKQEDVNLRYVFGPAPGREWWCLDAKNIELRLPAYEAGETEMIALFEEPDEPPYFGSNHLLVFDILHPEKWNHDDSEGLLKAKKKYASTWYQWTKNGNFAVQYGAVEQSGTADRAYHVPGGQKKIQGRFKNIAKLNQSMIAMANKYGYIETIPDKTVDPDRGYPLYCTKSRWGKVLVTVPLNYHIQGSAMWWMQKSMVRCQAYLNQINNQKDSEGYHIVMQVHDELVFDMPKGKGKKHIKILAGLMEEGGLDFGIPTPVSIEYHPENWAEGEEI